MALSNVGMLAWAKRTGGKLSRLDRAELMRQGILLQLKLLPVKWRKRFGLTATGTVLAVLERHPRQNFKHEMIS